MHAPHKSQLWWFNSSPTCMHLTTMMHQIFGTMCVCGGEALEWKQRGRHATSTELRWRGTGACNKADSSCDWSWRNRGGSGDLKMDSWCCYMTKKIYKAIPGKRRPETDPWGSATGEGAGQITKPRVVIPCYQRGRLNWIMVLWPKGKP
jgi:hypothetical protein